MCAVMQPGSYHHPDCLEYADDADDADDADAAEDVPFAPDIEWGMVAQQQDY